MNKISFFFTLISVFLHASWNLIGKRQAPSLAFFSLAIGASGLLLCPIVFWLGSRLAEMSTAFWLLLLASGCCQLFYLGGLAWAYSRGEISVLYPIVRGLPVVLVPIATLGLYGSVRLSPVDWLGFVCIVAGALLLPLSNKRSLALSTYFSPALAFAFLAAIGTVGYAIVDNKALELMVGSGFNTYEAGSVYAALQAIAIVVLSVPLIAAIPDERQALVTVLATERRSAIIAGIVMTATYGLVLVAMASSTDVSHIVALRQLSIPIGVLIGIIWLKESATFFKIFGVAIMLLGLFIVALA